jgi:hypothetical protein
MPIIPIQQVPKDVKKWPVLVIDMGFSETNRSAGMASANSGTAPPEDHRFSEIIGEVNTHLENLAADGKNSAILILEAPLSAAFTHEGNPCHRQIELQRNYLPGQRPRSPKGWYYQAGANLSLGSIQFLRSLDIPKAFELHLAEAFYCSVQANENHPDHHAVATELLEAFRGMPGKPLVKPSPETAGGKVVSLPGLEELVPGIPGVLLRPGLELSPATP